MPEITYVNRNFSVESLEVITHARRICAGYLAEGYDLTLRQLYYRFVALDLFGEDRWWLWVEATKRWVKATPTTPGATTNAQPNYKWLGGLVNDARLAGLLDWSVMVDRTRTLEELAHWDTPAELVKAAAKQFRMDRWAKQPVYVEAWIEKDALVGVLEKACPGEDVPFLSCRGYTSQSAMWGAAQRLGEHIGNGQKVVIIHLGDHDPSGIDMTRDIEERLAAFIAIDLGFEGVDCEPEDYLHATRDELHVKRIALNQDQVEQYDPPPNPAKLTDSRAKGYISKFGRSSWELDALDMPVLVSLVQDTIEGYRDPYEWDESTELEAEERKVLTAASARWTEVKDFLA